MRTAALVLLVTLVGCGKPKPAALCWEGDDCYYAPLRRELAFRYEPLRLYVPWVTPRGDINILIVEAPIAQLPIPEELR